jgi:hypothetical protein
MNTEFSAIAEIRKLATRCNVEGHGLAAALLQEVAAELSRTIMRNMHPTNDEIAEAGLRELPKPEPKTEFY